MHICEGYGGFYLHAENLYPYWMTKSTIANTLARGIRQQMPFYTDWPEEMLPGLEAFARLFFTDFTKGFDLIYHTTGARAGQTRSPILSSWNGSRPSWPTGSKQLESEELCQISELWKEEYPIGTKLSVIVFAVTTNKFLCDWHLRIKFVDDTTALDIIPRNSMFSQCRCFGNP